MASKSANNSKPKMGKVTLANSLGRISLNFTMTFKDGYSRYVVIVLADFDSSVTKLSRITLSLSNFSKYAMVRNSPSCKGVRGRQDKRS
jgi:hypothetical protein